MTPEFRTENFSSPTNVSKFVTNSSWPRPQEGDWPDPSHPYPTHASQVKVRRTSLHLSNSLSVLSTHVIVPLTLLLRLERPCLDRVLCPWFSGWKKASYLRHPGAGIMEADDHQVTTVFTVQPSFHHRDSTNRVSRSVTIVGERAVTPHLDVRRRW